MGCIGIERFADHNPALGPIVSCFPALDEGSDSYIGVAFKVVEMEAVGVALLYFVLTTDMRIHFLSGL